MDHIKNSTIAQPSKGSPYPAHMPPPRSEIQLREPNEVGVLTPWQVDFRQLDPGPLSTQIALRASATVSLTQLCLSGRVHQRGVPPEGWTTFGLVTPPQLSSWQGTNVGHNALLGFGTRDGYDCVSEAGFTGKVLSFNSKCLSHIARACGFDLPQAIETSGQFFAPDCDRGLHRLDKLFNQLLGDDTDFWSPEEEEALIFEALLFVNAGERHVDKSRANTRAHAIKRALDMMHTRIENPVPISEICWQCGVTWRTLDRAFKDRFGVGPKAYYNRLRLSRVREDLLKGTATGTVSDAANRYGFWHMGQFARDYRKFFGELPSQTRQRSEYL